MGNRGRCYSPRRESSTQRRARQDKETPVKDNDLNKKPSRVKEVDNRRVKGS